MSHSAKRGNEKKALMCTSEAFGCQRVDGLLRVKHTEALYAEKCVFTMI